MATPRLGRQEQGGDAPPRPAAPGKRWEQVTKVVDGHDTLEWVEVDDVAGPTWPARSELRVLDKDIRRVDGPDKVTGRARYTHDVRLPGMLYGRLLLCPYPAASFELDLGPALALEGVEAAIVLREEAARFLGEPVAAVAARTPELAEDAVRAIRVEWNEEPWVATVRQAEAEGAPAVTRRGNVRHQREEGDREAAQAAIEACATKVEATYRVPSQHHVCLETHGIVVDWRGGEEATVYASTQGTFAMHDQVPGLLELEKSRVKVLVEHMGGGFGSKFGPGAEGLAACKLSLATKAPVHLMLGRTDEFLMAGTRSAATATVSAGLDADGKLAGMVSEITRDGGIAPGSHPGLPYVYTVGSPFVSVRSVHTNLDASRAFRAPGHPQASFAMESVLDELAVKGGVDPLELRIANLENPTYHRQLARCADEIGWADHPHRIGFDDSDAELKTGIGFGVSTWGGGGRPVCEVEVRIERDGSVRVLSGTQDLGTGTRTWVAAVVAEELGLEVADVEARIGSSEYGAANASGGSTTVASLAPAVKHAAFGARQALLSRCAEELGVAPDSLALTPAGVVGTDGSAAYSFDGACALLGPTGLSARGEWQSQLSSAGVQGAQAARVEVDTLTGAVRVVKMVCVQNLGLVLNRLATRSQIHGGMIQALSYALLEGRVVDADLGLQLNANLEDYRIAGCLEIPELVVVLDDEDERGVIGVGEPPIIPGAGAIANAVANACGARIRELPITPDKVLMALAAGGGR